VLKSSYCFAICETFSNLTAGKIITKGNKRFIIHSGKSNLTPAHQINTLQSLRTNPDIIIKPTDKGEATVILTRQLYEAEVLRQLNNTQYYTSLTQPKCPDTAQQRSF